MKKFTLLCFISFACSHSATSSSGIFGPSNYDECVAEGIKGSTLSGVEHARRACHRKFEAEISLYYNSFDNKDWSWEKSDEKTILVKIVKMPVDYEVTKIKLLLSITPCNDLKNDAFEFEKIVNIDSGPFFGVKNEGRLSIDNSFSIKCGRVKTLYGKLMN